VCSGEIVTYTAPYFSGTEYTWAVSPAGMILNGQNTNAISVKWNDVSSVTNGSVSVNYGNCFLACSGSDQINVQITPTISVAGDFHVCAGEVGSALAQAGFFSPIPATVEWEIWDTNENVLFTAGGMSSTFNYTFNVAPGDYYWVAKNSTDSYCNELARQLVQVTATPLDPIQIEGETDICPGVEYGYMIESAGSYNTIWTITDGLSQINYQGATCSHTFGSTPPYMVEAVHSDIYFQECQSNAIQLSLISAADKEISGNESVCFESIEPYTIDFIGGTDYNWEIIPPQMGEIQTTNTNEVNVFWSEAGNVILRLNICGISIDKSIIINPIPVFNVVGITSACGNEQTTISTDQPAFNHEWKNEEGFVIGINPTIDLYPGHYSVAVTDLNECISEEIFFIDELPFPSVNITSPAIDIFCNTIPGGIPLVTNTDGNGYTFRWFNITAEVGTGPIYNALDFGTYAVEATNIYGCITMSPPVSIGECCPVDSCISSQVCNNPGGCLYLPYDFDIEITETECQQKTYTATSPDIIPGSGRWEISSLSVSYIAAYTGDVANHEYLLPGYYRVVHGAKVDGYNYPGMQCDHQDITLDTVRLVADFSAGKTCVGEAVSFEDLTTFLPGETITSWTWDFGDPASGPDNLSNIQNPQHTFLVGGIYLVQLTVTSGSGCFSTKEINITISNGPDLQLTFDQINCENEATAFQLDGNVFDIEWNFDDPASMNENNAYHASVMHTFETPANYMVSVSASDVLGCVSSTIVNVDIRANTLSGNIGIDPASIFCQGETANLTAPSGGVSWLWSTGEDIAQITVSEGSQYSVFMRDVFNCTYTTPAEFIQVNPKPIVLIGAREFIGLDQFGQWQNNMAICDGTDFELQALSPTGVSYQWAHGPTTQSLSFLSASPNYPGPGVHIFSVVGTDLVTGCISEEDQITVEIFALPEIPVITLAAGSGCSSDQNTLWVSNPKANITYIWSDGQSGTSIETAAEGIYFVEAISPEGCISISNPITIQPAAAVDQIAGGCFVACDPLTVCLPDIQNVASYTIFQNGSALTSGTNWPTDFLISQDGSYTIEIVTTNGCSATSEPLDVILYQGVGVITVLTYEDVDDNGVFSAADVPVGQIPVKILSQDGLHIGMTETGPNGQFDFVDFPTENYEATINQDLLHPMWLIVLDSVSTQLNTCDDSVSIILLVKENCTIVGPDVQYQMCPGDSFLYGDSTWIDTGFYEVHFTSAAGCDSMINVSIGLPDTLLISIQVWMDIDKDGVVSSADTTLPGIQILLEEILSGTQYNANTSTDPALFDVSSIEHQASIVLSSLPDLTNPIISSAFISTSECGIVELNFLIEDLCSKITIADQVSLCAGDSIQIGDQWLSEEGTHNVLVSAPGVCDTLYQITVDLFPALNVDGSAMTVCDVAGGIGSIELTVDGDGPFSYQWAPQLPGDSIQTELPPGSYHVLVTDQYGCSTQDSFVIDSLPILAFHLDSFYSDQQGSSVVLNITGNIDIPGITISWSPSEFLSCSDCIAPVVTPLETTFYEASIQDASGCTYFLHTTVEVFQDTFLSQFFAPNVFTPNDDGKNDMFKIFNPDETAHLIKMVIFDRWGEVVFQETDIPLSAHQGWDGKRNNEPLNDQVLVYLAEIRMSSGEIHKISGDITVIR
jgi:gliding motility-associated-like protein